MISKDLRISEIAPRHFARLLKLMDPPRGHDPVPEGSGPFGLLDRLTGAERPTAEDLDEAPEQPDVRFPVLVLTRGGEVLRLVRLFRGGTLPSGSLRSTELEDLRAFREKHRLPFVAAIDIEALPRIWTDVQAAIHFDDDLVAQQLAALRVLRRALSAGELIVEPRLIGNMPVPPYPVVQRTFDRVLPDGRSIVFYIVDRRRVWTSVIAVKERGDLQLITTHEAIAKELRFEQIRRDAPRVIAAVTRRFAPPHIGLFLPLSSWHRLVCGDRSAIARAVSSQRAVLDPCPPWLLALVGVGAVSEAASQSARLAGRLLSRTGLLPRAEKLFQTVTNPLEALGVDPWEAISWSRDWSRRILPLL